MYFIIKLMQDKINIIRFLLLPEMNTSDILTYLTKNIKKIFLS